MSPERPLPPLLDTAAKSLSPAVETTWYWAVWGPVQGTLWMAVYGALDRAVWHAMRKEVRREP